MTNQGVIIEGYPDYKVFPNGEIVSYRVSSEGRVRAASKGKDGYWRIILCYAPGVHHTKYVHRLVAKAHVSNPDGKPDVNHKDHNPDNNSADNLEWVTHAENIQKAVKHWGNWVKSGVRGRQVIATPAKGGPETRWANARLAAIALGHWNKAANICTALKTGRGAYGFFWRYAEPEAAKRRWEARQGRGADWSPVVDREATTFSARTGQVERKVIPVLPSGVMKGSEMEGRG